MTGLSEAALADLFCTAIWANCRASGGAQRSQFPVDAVADDDQATQDASRSNSGVSSPQNAAAAAAQLLVRVESLHLTAEQFTSTGKPASTTPVRLLLRLSMARADCRCRRSQAVTVSDDVSGSSIGSPPAPSWAPALG